MTSSASQTPLVDDPSVIGKLLEKNRSLQQLIEQRLDDLRRQQCRNRQQAVLTTQRLRWNNQHSSVATSSPSCEDTGEWRYTPLELHHFPLQHVALISHSRSACQVPMQSTDLSGTPSRSPRPRSSNPYRILPPTRFFVDRDKKKKEPKPNADTQKRRLLEEQTFLWHKQPPLVEKDIQPWKNREDFDVEAELPAMATSLNRSVEECRLFWKRMNRKPFQQDELQLIRRRRVVKNGRVPPSWGDIARELPSRSVIECLMAYYQQICPRGGESWTPTQDELLWKLVAAAGPQCVWDKSMVTHLVHGATTTSYATTTTRATTPCAGASFMAKSRRQIMCRLNQTLLNPKLRRTAWTASEERKLVIWMKCYRDSKKDLYCASQHLPHRATNMVANKWHRTLNPEYSTEPFTRQEDQALLKAVREHGMGWAELSVSFFPHRHPHRLYARWEDLASDQDVLQRYYHGDKPAE